jgi:hypothetical protein
MGSCEALFLQMEPYLISHLKLMLYPMVIVVLFVLGIGFLQNIMKFLLDVLDLFNKFCCSISLGLSIGELLLCRCNGKSYVNWSQ